MCAAECVHPFFGDERKYKIARMKAENGKKQLALAEIAVLAAMKLKLGTCCKNAYRYGENQKPCATNEEDGFLSIAHAGECGACIWADTPVGTDMEEKHRDISRIYERIRSENDSDTCSAVGLWCAKESYVKLTGEGLSKPFCEISVHKDSVESGGKCFFLASGEEKGYVWAVAMKEKRDVNVLFISVREALEIINA